MDIVLYFIFVMCLFNRCECTSSNGTLVLSDRPCNEIVDINPTNIKFVPVTYAEVLEKENEILELLNDGQKLRLADNGMIHKLPIIGCFKVWNKPDGWPYDIYEIKNIVRLISANPKQLFKYCIESNYRHAGILASTCGCVPFQYIDSLSEVNPEYCMSYDISYNTGDIYMFVFDLQNNRDWFSEYLTSCRILRNYVYINGYADIPHTFLGGRCGIPVNGTLCFYSNQTIIDTDHCKTVFKRYFPHEHYKVCASTKQSNEECINRDSMCPYFGYIPDTYLAEDNFDLYHRDLGVFSVNIKSIKLLYILDRRVDKTVSLIREAGRLFVETEYRSIQMDHLCMRIEYIEHSEGQILQITLITVGVVSFILLVATLVAVLILKKRGRQNIDSNNSDTHNRNNAIELQSICSTRGASSRSGGSSRNSVCSSHGGSLRRSGSSTSGGSVSGSTQDDGAVPGRMPVIIASQPATDGEVPGRTSRGYNPAYLRS